MATLAASADTSADASAPPSGSTETVVGAGVEVRRSGGRMEFLDALRGLAATLVLLQHSLEQLSYRYRTWTTTWVRFGELGVVLFFLCSGFIIPASIERYGSVARFWIGRFFRLYPMYWAALIAAFLLAHRFHRYPLPTDPNGSVHLFLTNATMVERMLQAPLFVGAAWSLAYEVVFYLGVTALFVAGVYRRSVRIAGIALVVTALTAGFKAAAYTSIGNQGAGGIAWMVAAFVGILGVLVLLGRLSVGRTVAVAALLALIVPLVANRTDALWFAFLLFATMFTGTILYRTVHGDLAWRTAYVMSGALVVVTVFAWRRAIIPFADPGTGARISWYGESLTFLIAYALFGVGLALRNHAFPWVARELGRVSYSLYLIHPLIILSIPAGHGMKGKAWTALVWIGGSLVVAMITYRVIERPFINLGRKVTTHWSARRSRRVAASEEQVW